jgi:hypothetical protein
LGLYFQASQALDLAIRPVGARQKSRVLERQRPGHNGQDLLNAEDAVVQIGGIHMQLHDADIGRAFGHGHAGLSRRRGFLRWHNSAENKGAEQPSRAK